MGSLFENSKRSKEYKGNKVLSKGQRLGWVHKSDYEPALLRTIGVQHEKLTPYTTGPFSLNKLVP